MTYSLRNTSGNHAAWESVLSISAIALATLLVLGSASGLEAADEQSGPFLLTSSTRTAKEIQIEARIRRALRQDAQLKSLNLAVELNGGIANLSGPVPTEDLKQRAIKIVRSVEGVLSVCAKELYISSSEPVGKRLAVVVQEDLPTQSRSASPDGTWNVDRASNNSPSTNGRQVTLLAPETAPAASPALPSTKPVDGKLGGARLTANPHPALPGVCISDAVEQLRQRETRYQQIRARVEGSTVFVFPGDTATEDAMMFAQAVRRLPGVQHVILSSDPR
jgi:osmotically-inducible protein OsmY